MLATLIAMATTAIPQMVAAQEAGVMSLLGCRMKVRSGSSSLTVTCDAIVPDDAVPGIASGITVTLGNSTTPACYEAIVIPTLSGSCWKHRGRSGDPVSMLSLCQNRSDQGEYRLTVRLEPSGDGASCLTDPNVTMAVAAGTAIGQVTCTRSSDSGACVIPAVTDEQCRNSSPFDDCSTPASIDCDGSPYNCKQPTKRCDPRPRAARRDNPNLMCFPAEVGAPIVDSRGGLLGTLRESRVRLNYGVHRWIGGNRKVMAFTVETDRGTRTGWIDVARVRNIPTDFLAVAPLATPPGGTTPRPLVADNWSTADRELHTDPQWCGSNTGRALHYLLREYRTVNLTWSTPGLGSPTAEIYSIDQGLIFHQSSLPPLQVPLFDCVHSGPVKTMTFVYGHVEAGRYGWIAEANLGAPVPTGPDPTGDPRDCSIGCCSGHQALNRRAASEQACRAMAAGECNASPIRNLYFDGRHIAHSDCLCCAKCKGFTKYHVVQGVQWGRCTSESRALCKRHKRDLFDATWGNRSGSSNFCEG